MEIKLEKKVLEDKSNNFNDLISLDSFRGPPFLVTKKLREKGYDISGHAGIRRKEPLSSFMGILKDRKPIEKKFMGVKWNKNQKALLLGTLWFNDIKRNAHEEKKWVLEIYGKEYAPALTKLIYSLSKAYNVEMQVKLKSQYPGEESYLSDLASQHKHY